MNRNITALSILLLAGIVIAGASGAFASVAGTHAADKVIDTQSSVNENKDIKEHSDSDGNETDNGNGADASVDDNASQFTNPTEIDNKYYPLESGTTFTYEGTKDGQPTRDVFAVTNETKVIEGVTTRVIHDNLYVNGNLSEKTDDWFAQDDAGNVWYFGEFSTEIDTGSHEGSWQAGVNGAKPGIVMEAHPKVGDTYQQELAIGVAEDKATVLSLSQSICVPYGCFSDVLQTKDFSPLKPGIVEHKYFASGVGQIKVIMVQGGSEEEHLVNIKKGE